MVCYVMVCTLHPYAYIYMYNYTYIQTYKEKGLLEGVPHYSGLLYRVRLAGNVFEAGVGGLGF